MWSVRANHFDHMALFTNKPVPAGSAVIVFGTESLTLTEAGKVIYKLKKKTHKKKNFKAEY